MPQLDIIKNYADNTELDAAQLNSAFDSISDFINNVKLDEENIQPGTLSSSALADSAVTTSKLAASSVTLAKLATEVLEKLIQPGDVKMTASTAVDAGWLYCDGSAISRTTYAALFAKIGTAYGYGDNATTFNIPESRGLFMRGQNDGSGNDPLDGGGRTAVNAGGNIGDNIGSLQDSATQTHNHALSDPTHAHQNINSGATGATNTAPGVGNPGFATATTTQTTFNGTGISLAASGASASETRPKNINMRFYIKT